jgi:TldD protein
MPVSTRRDFLATTSLALAGAVLGPRGLHAQRLPAIMRSSFNANTFFPEPIAPPELRTLATQAIDAAQHAGASYADIRVAECQRLYLIYNGLECRTILESHFTYGIRVIVDGTWAFVHGTHPSSNAVTASARNAVATARGYARLTKHRVELTRTPAVTGEWATPCAIDPFSVPLEDQAALMSALAQAVVRVRYGDFSSHAFDWTRELRTFASSEGTLITQTLRGSNPTMWVSGDRGLGDGGRGSVNLHPPHVRAVAGGYETLTDLSIADAVTRTGEEAVRLAAFPRRTLDVGRYPVVFDGRALSRVLGYTLGQALELDRVLGDEVDASGTSYLSPPHDILGTTVASPLLTVTADRASSSPMAVKWDDEGVEPQASTMIRNGQLVDYLSSRQTATVLQPWYERQGVSPQSRGCAVAPRASDPVAVRVPHLTMAVGDTGATLEELCKNIGHGILLRDDHYFSTDHKLASGNITTSFKGVMLEIERGKIVRRLERNGFQFSTGAFWKSLLALGGMRTVCNTTFDVYKGQPWVPAVQSVTAPAGLFKEVNVFSLPKRL